MQQYDLIVIGSGSGMEVLEEAVNHNFKAALIDKGPLGGTCLNLGCIPSKMLIYPADRIVDIQQADKLGIHAEIKNIDFASIMERMRKNTKEEHDEMQHAIVNSTQFDYYNGEGFFTGDYTLEINNKSIKGKKILIASGSRPFIPPIKGIEKVNYLTNESVLQLKQKPESLIIVGGGYIGVEYAHFFAAMGTKTTIVEMSNRLLLTEEPEISDLLKKKLSERMTIYTGTQAEEIKAENDCVTISVKDNLSGEKKNVTALNVMIAVGRRSNADVLRVEKTGIEIDNHGYIKTNEQMETTKQNIWAIGDADGKYMFRHTANMEAGVAIKNIIQQAGLKMDYRSVPHAVFTHPQIASVGLTEEESRKNKIDILVGKAFYKDTAKGIAMMEDESFAKAIVAKETGAIIGFHIIGSFAATLIQEVVNAMAYGGNLEEIASGIHIHPALSEVIQRTFSNLE